MADQKRIDVMKIMEILAQTYPEARTALNFATPFELLVATVLSAQSTDRQVNTITSRLFRKYNTPADFAGLTPEELAREIQGCGLYRHKSENIIAASRLILAEFNGQVPQKMEDLLRLPGVGRKTANVVLANAFAVPALAVDTHVFRVAHRLGLSEARDPEKTESDLCAIVPRELWSQAHHWFIYHGRQACRARKPLCDECPLAALCPGCIKPAKGTGRGCGGGEAAAGPRNS